MLICNLEINVNWIFAQELAPSVVEELVHDAKEALAAMATNKHLKYRFRTVFVDFLV